MKCLAVNTATKVVSIAIVDEDRTLYLFESPETRDQGNALMGHIQRGLALNNIGFFDLDALAVVTGPGSFTGIRIGLAAMRGVALAADKPLIGVSSFDMFAARAPGAVSIIAVESWREELYLEARDDGGGLLMECANETPAVFLRRFRQRFPGEQKIIVSGDAGAAIAPLLKQATLSDRKATAADVAHLALTAFKKGDVPARPMPYYLREADVTISAKIAKTVEAAEG